MRMMTRKTETKLAVMALSMLAAMPAQAAGLQRATSVVNSLTGDVKTIVPVLAILVLVCLGVAWGLKWIRFVTLVQFGAGIILAGSAAEVVAMLFS